MKFAILGIGKTGQAMACYLLAKQQEVVLWDRKEEKVFLIQESGIEASGVVAGHFYPKAEADLTKAVCDADCILVMTTSSGHLPVSRLLSGKLPKNGRILILNGNWGALEFYNTLGDECREKNVLLAETGGMPILSDSSQTGFCRLTKIKNSVATATIPSCNIYRFLSDVGDIFPFLVSGQNVIETSINNTNPILHAPITLFNLSRIENGEDYSFYGTAASRCILDYAAKADRERIDIAQASGAKGESALDILNGFWTDQYDNLYDAIKNNATYVAGKGPTSLQYRYITEDIPYGIAPLVYLSKQLGVHAPRLSALLEMYNLLFDRDFMQDGPKLTEDSLHAATE